MDTHSVLVFVHVITVVFMSVPLYNLVVVNERARMGGQVGIEVDRFFENIIRGGARRCYVFQTTALISGVALVIIDGFGWASLWGEPIIALKTVILFMLMGLLSYVAFALQPRIDGLLALVTEGPIPAEVGAKIKPLRLRRKRLAALCLFLVITEIVLGMQVFSIWPLGGTIAIEFLAALFAWRAYKSVMPFGWI